MQDLNCYNPHDEVVETITDVNKKRLFFKKGRQKQQKKCVVSASFKCFLYLSPFHATSYFVCFTEPHIVPLIHVFDSLVTLQGKTLHTKHMITL